MRGFFSRTGGLSRELEISLSPSSFTGAGREREKMGPGALGWKEVAFGEAERREGKETNRKERKGWEGKKREKGKGEERKKGMKRKERRERKGKRDGKGMGRKGKE